MGATINGKHTDEMHLKVMNTDIVGFPKPKILRMEIPGSSKFIDLTESLTGKCEFEGRTIKLELAGENHPGIWPTIVSDLLRSFHGKFVKVILDDDLGYYYQGRATISEFARNRRVGVVLLTVDADAFKYERFSSTEDWIWDVFSFENGIIREYTNLTLSDNEPFYIPGSSIDMIPTFKVSGISRSPAYIIFHGNQYEVRMGDNMFTDIKIPEEGAEVRVLGISKLDIEVRGGCL